LLAYTGEQQIVATVTDRVSLSLLYRVKQSALSDE